LEEGLPSETFFQEGPDMPTTARTKTATLKTLPGDDVRHILWRFADRYDLQMLVTSARAVARGPVARLVAAGVRNTHESRNTITPASPPSDWPGFNGGAATASLAGCLALAPIHERGAEE